MPFDFAEVDRILVKIIFLINKIDKTNSKEATAKGKLASINSKETKTNGKEATTNDK